MVSTGAISPDVGKHPKVPYVHEGNLHSVDVKHKNRSFEEWKDSCNDISNQERMKIEGNHIRIGIFILDGNQGNKNDPRRNYDRNNIASNDFKAIKPWKNTKFFYLFRHEPVEQKVFRFEVSVDDG